jgi:uncharacterized protein (UPF0303 family)
MTENFPTTEQVLAQTKELVFTQFDESDALALGMALVSAAQASSLGVVINIRTPNRTLFHAALKGSAPLNDRWALRKSNTALLFGQSSLQVGCANRAAGQDMTRHGLSAAEYADNGGAVPVVVAGVGVVAVVTVSGLPQVQDHEMVIAALRAHLTQPAS